MAMPRHSAFASLSVVGVGACWGLYWMPLQALQASGVSGAWATFVVLALAGLVLAPAAWRGRYRLRSSSFVALASLGCGGASFALYSDGLIYGQVTVVILLFYLTPVWSTLIERFWLARAISPWRYGAIAFGLVGIALVLHARHRGLPLPHTLGDWLGLASGALWSLASTGISQHSRTRPLETNFVFCAGAALLALVLALVLGAGRPEQITSVHYGAAALWALLIGGFWWAVLLSVFMWATQLLEPARVGVLLMSEAIVGATSAALFASEPFGTLMIAGTGLVIVAGAMETLPKQQPRSPTRSRA